MVCKNCGQQILENPCPYCNVMQDEAVNPNAKSRTTAGFLQIFAGALGLGRFYLGYTSRGVLQIIVSMISCGMIGLIWGVLDGILILNGYLNVDAKGNALRD